MKFQLKTILFVFVVLAAIVAFFVRWISLPKNIVELRDSLSTIELHCQREELLRGLGIFKEPERSTLGEPHPMFVLDSWELESGYRLVIFYNNVDGTLVYQKGIIIDGDDNIIPASGQYTNRGLQMLRTGLPTRVIGPPD